MIHLLGKIPKPTAVAVSGGPDSMAVLDFVYRKYPDTTAIHFNHGTKHSKKAQELVENYCKAKNIPLTLGKITRSKFKKESPEEYFRNERYAFFDNVDSKSIILGHHLDDSIETWIFTAAHGNPRLIPYKRGKYIRPFLTNKKSSFENWCRRNDVPYLVDPTNSDTIHVRNRIRHDVIPGLMYVNPGIHKVIKKKVIEEYQNL